MSHLRTTLPALVVVVALALPGGAAALSADHSASAVADDALHAPGDGVTVATATDDGDTGDATSAEDTNTTTADTTGGTDASEATDGSETASTNGTGAEPTDAVGDAADTTENTTDAVADTTETVDDASGDAAESPADTGDATGNATDAVEGTADGVENATDGATDAVEDATDAVEESGDAAAETGDAVVDADANGSVELRADGGLDPGANATATAVAGGGTATAPTAGTPTPRSPTPTANASAGAGADAGRDGTAGTGPLARDGGGTGLPTPAEDPVTVGVGVGASVVAAGAAGRALAGGGTATASTATGTAVDLLGTLRRALGDRLWRVLGLAGYTRHADDPLEHDTRAELAEFVDAEPGAYLTELAEATDTPMGTVRYHLKVLERQEVLACAKVHGKRRYYPAGDAPDELAAALDDEGAGDVLRALARVGPSSVSGLAEELDRDPSTVTHHLERLSADGLVERERDGRAVVNRLDPATEAALSPRVEAERSGVGAGAAPASGGD